MCGQKLHSITKLKIWKWASSKIGFKYVLDMNATLQRGCVLRKLNGAGLLSGKWTSAKDRSTESLIILGGVPVLRRPTLSPSRSLRVWDSPELDGASPIRPPGLEVWPTKRDPDRKVPVVRTTEWAEIFWLPFAVDEDRTIDLAWIIISTLK